MTASEFAFLALGLVLGAAAGAAILEILRSRPPAPREVRVTMAPATVPGRSVTLAGDPFAGGTAGPAPGGPGDRRSIDRSPVAVAIDDLDVGPPFLRTPLAVPVAAAPTQTRQGAGTGAVRTAVLIGSPPPTLAAAVAPAAGGIPAKAGPGATLGAGTATTAGAVAVAERPAGASPAVAVAAATPVLAPAREIGVAPAEPPPIAIVAAARRPTGEPAADENARAIAPCAELRAAAEDRCAMAARARETADGALATLHDAQRTYDEQSRVADEAEAQADPRGIRTAKEAAQQAFRAARDRAATRDDLEAAARSWLDSINRINLESRDAAARAGRARAAANSLVTTIERLGAEADAARVAKEMAEEACVAARQAVAECEEAATLAAAAAIVPAPLAAIEPATRFPDDEPELTPIEAGEREARIMRLLRGDREALIRTVGDLSGEDPAERRRWQVALTGLVDAITAQAIDASIIDVPDQPPFWAPFTSVQRRDILAALASLGYRFDGLGGFADGRVPSQRDLSLALGYAGLDPMRVRRWPNEAEARELLSEARVAADEYLAAAAGGLTLSELIDLLGRRADGLTDLWNEWGRVRGRLLAID